MSVECVHIFFFIPTNTNMPVCRKGTHVCGCNLFAIFEINKRSVLMLRHTELGGSVDALLIKFQEYMVIVEPSTIFST